MSDWNTINANRDYPFYTADNIDTGSSVSDNNMDNMPYSFADELGYTPAEYTPLGESSHTRAPFDTGEILDAHFFLINPGTEEPSVWLSAREETEQEILYEFTDSDGRVLTFRYPLGSGTATLWAEGVFMSGMIVVRAQEAI